MFNEFLQEEDGAQVIEYALVIAIISLALIIGLQLLVTDDPIGAVVTRVTTCLTTPSNCT